jgi:hypothetical protein
MVQDLLVGIVTMTACLTIQAFVVALLLEALNGVLMIGITTGFLFMLLTTLMQRAWKQRMAEHEANATK